MAVKQLKAKRKIGKTTARKPKLTDSQMAKQIVKACRAIDSRRRMTRAANLLLEPIEKHFQAEIKRDDSQTQIRFAAAELDGKFILLSSKPGAKGRAARQITPDAVFCTILYHRRHVKARRATARDEWCRVATVTA